DLNDLNSSMSVRTKRGLGLDKYIGEGELGIDDSVFSIFHTTSDDLEGKPIYNSYLHLIKVCDFHEQKFAKRNAEGKGKLGRRPTGKPVNPNRPNPVSAGQRNAVSAGLAYPVSAGQPYLVSAGQPNPVSVGQQNTVSAGPPNPVYAGQPNPVSVGQQNTVSAGPPNPVYASQPNPVSAGNGILGP
nr:hypothetical protein [Tanacetum cinerariifolium]